MCIRDRVSAAHLIGLVPQAGIEPALELGEARDTDRPARAEPDDPRGAVIGQVEPAQEGMATVAFDRAALEEFREKFPVAKDADDFALRL